MDILFFLSCVFYAFVRVCLYVPCGHLLGKGWPLGSRLWCLTVSCFFPIGILGQVWYLIASIPDLCTLSYCRYQLVCFISQDLEVRSLYHLYSLITKSSQCYYYLVIPRNGGHTYLATVSIYR